MNSFVIGVISIFMFIFYCMTYKMNTKGSIPFCLYIYYAMFPFKMRAIGISALDDIVLKGLLLIGVGVVILNSIIKTKIKFNMYEFLFFIMVVISDCSTVIINGYDSNIKTGIINIGFMFVVSFYTLNVVKDRKGVLSLIRCFSINGFVLSACAIYESVRYGTERVSVSLNNPNFLGFFLCICFAFGIYSFLQNKSKLELANVIFIGVGVASTGSYTCIAGLVLILLIFLFVKDGKRSSATAVIMMVSVYILFAVSIWLVISGKYANIEIVKKILENKDDTRIYIWRNAWAQWKNSPVLGIGYNEFYLPITGIDHDMVTHNDYLRLLVETGVIGFIVFTVYLFVQIFKCRNIGMTERKLTYSLMIFTAIFSMFHNNMNSIIFWFVLSFVAYGKLLSDGKNDVKEETLIDKNTSLWN